MSEELRHIDDSEFVARAIFSPTMIDSSGKIATVAFTLRHNESYISVAQMSIENWLDDIKSIPVNSLRQLYGYGQLNVGEIRSIEIHFFDNTVQFCVEDKSSENNKSHAGIIVLYGTEPLKGDKIKLLKPLQERIPASMLLLKIQSKLANIANKKFVRL
jgi:hypothetical protein